MPGIISWDTAICYPPFWEYTTACQADPENSNRTDKIYKFLEPVLDAFVIEQIRQRYFGDLP
jgi:hypothetical protein